MICLKRNATQALINWKNSEDRKPMVLKGARQVGKTWLMKSFGCDYYDNFVYFNFDEEDELKSIFAANKNPQRIIELLSMIAGEKILPEKTLIIFDEIQECPEALNTLKYFKEKANEYHVIAAGSLLGTLLAQPKSYPVGMVNLLDIYPLTFDEFQAQIKQAIYVSATPAKYELEQADNVVEQIIRPTGLLDPQIEIRPIKGQIDDLLGEINKVAAAGERVLVTTLTKRMAEDLTEYLKQAGVRVRYLHSEIATIERAEIIDSLRAGKFDVLVGINLLREGLDLPEVSLIAILDADKEGFLRSDTAMIQTIGRAARNAHGRVIMYADRITDSMQRAIDETNRRREKQQAYNEEHHITPKTIYKEQRQLIKLTKVADTEEAEAYGSSKKLKQKSTKELNTLARELERRMQEAAKALDFEAAAELRDQLIIVKGQLGQKLVPKKKKK